MGLAQKPTVWLGWEVSPELRVGLAFSTEVLWQSRAPRCFFAGLFLAAVGPFPPK